MDDYIEPQDFQVEFLENDGWLPQISGLAALKQMGLEGTMM